jgi:hypothetical protein
MAGATGLEPATFGVTGRHSNQLSYAPACGFERAKGADVGRGIWQVKFEQEVKFMAEVLPVFPLHAARAGQAWD